MMMFFFPLFVAIGLAEGNVFGGGPLFGGSGAIGLVYLVVLIVAGLVRIGLFAKGLSTRELSGLRTLNNVGLALAIVVAVLAGLNFDILTLGFVVPLLVNRFV